MYMVSTLLEYNGKLMGIRLLELGLSNYYDVALNKIPEKYKNRLDYKRFYVDTLIQHDEKPNLLVTESEMEDGHIATDISNDENKIEGVFSKLTEKSFIGTENPVYDKEGQSRGITLKGYGASGLGYQMSQHIDANFHYEKVGEKMLRLTCLTESEKYPKGTIIYVGIKNIEERR